MIKSNFQAGLLSLLPFFAFANIEPSELTELSFDELMAIEITSVSKKSEELSQAAAAVYVVTQNEIRRSGATSIPEALRLVPGVDVAQIDPNKWAIGIRGFNGRFANKLLVMIDGRSVYTPTFSGVYWDHLDYLMNDIERIEVIRGPGATLWGANAVNGVINIITKEAADTQGGLLSLAAGNELKGLAGLRQGGEISDQAHVRVYAKGKRLDEGQDLSGQTQENGGDYLQTGFRLDWQHTENQWLTFQGDLYRNDMAQEHMAPEFQSPFGLERLTGEVEVDGGNLGLRWGQLTSLDSELSINLNYDYYDRQELKFSERRDTFDLDLQHQFSLFENHELVWGGGYRRSDSEVTDGHLVSANDPTSSTEIWNLFIQDEILFPTLDLSVTLGVKVEDNTYSDTEIQPNLRASWVPNNQFTLWGAASRSKRTPSLGEADFALNIKTLPPFALDPTNPLPTLIQVQGQPSFDAEQMDAYELGMRWMPTSELAFDLATFYNDYDNLRSYGIGNPGGQMIGGQLFAVMPLELSNNMEGSSSGLELLATWQATENSRFRLGYSLLDVDLKDSQPHFLSGDLISLVEDRSPQHQASIWGSFDLTSALELDIRLFYVDQRPWSLNQLQGVDSNFNGDLRIGWYPMDMLSLSLVGRNLLTSSQQEFLIETWPAPSEIERSVFLKAEVTW